MSLHDEIMNLLILPGLPMVNATESQLLAYKMGHRDARHAAAELALKADARIAELEAALQAAIDALAGGLWDYGPGQDEHDKCEEVLVLARAALEQKP